METTRKGWQCQEPQKLGSVCTSVSRTREDLDGKPLGTGTGTSRPICCCPSPGNTAKTITAAASRAWRLQRCAAQAGGQEAALRQAVGRGQGGIVRLCIVGRRSCGLRVGAGEPGDVVVQHTAEMPLGAGFCDGGAESGCQRRVAGVQQRDWPR